MGEHVIKLPMSAKALPKPSWSNGTSRSATSCVRMRCLWPS